MGKNFTVNYFKYLLLIFLFKSFLFFPAHSSTQQKADTVDFQLNDTTKLPGNDTNNMQVKGPRKPPVPDSVIYSRVSFTKEDLVRGERLFYGLVYPGDKSIDCASCHNTHLSDTMNWNPDALEISRMYQNKSAMDLSNVLLKPTGQHMILVHKDFQLSPEEITLIKAYMDQFVDIGITKGKPVITNLLILIFASIFFLFSIIDLIIKKTFKYPQINLAIITITLVVITYILVKNAISLNRYAGFSPDQPIKFSHAVHAGQNQTDCVYCHYSVETAKTAGIPPANVCMNCHFLVRTGTRSGAHEIAKVINNFDNNIPVEWIRIYKLPDFTYFNHAQHVTAGKIDCATCHGDVKEIDRLSQIPDLSMGWCLDCHDTRKVNLSNEYYKHHYNDFYTAHQSGQLDSTSVSSIGGRDCGHCHY